MLKKTITYKNFNNEEVSEDFYFHLTEAEITKLEMGQKGGLSEALKRIIESEDGAGVIEILQHIILTAYGKRSEDGKRFIKNDLLRQEFESTQAFSDLFMEMATNADAASTFVNGIIPGDMAEKVAKLTGADLSIVPNPEVEKKASRIITRAELARLPQEELQKLGAKISTGEVVIAPEFPTT